MTVPLNLRCFPAADRAFRRRVEILAEDVEASTSSDGPARLQAVLRELYYRRATVSPRQAAATTDEGRAATWYVFRDGAATAAAAEPRRVLVVDDDEAFVTMVQALLVEEGFAVQCARDGLEALDRAAAFAPDVILLDLHMPRASGEEFARLYSLAPEPRANIVVISGRPQAAMRALELGARAVVPKPFEADPFIELMRQYA